MSKRRHASWITAALSSVIMVALTACGSAEPSTLQAASTAPSPSSEPSVAPAPSPSSSPATSAEPSPEEAAEPGLSVVKPTYRMNGAYRIVPVDKGKTTDKVVLLTFDDGPKEAEMLGKILDTLDKHEAKAIFFVNGYRVKQNPDLLKEIDARGQTIGNHSYDHIQLNKQTSDVVREQIEGVQQIVEEVTGKTPAFFRPPFGAANDDVRRIAKNNGLLFMTWSNGSFDWDLGKNVKDKPQAVIDNVLGQLHPGSNILMHELKWTAEALDRLLTELENRGYSFVDPAAIEISLE